MRFSSIVYNLIYSSDGHTLLKVPSDVETFRIREGVWRIDEYAFEGDIGWSLLQVAIGIGAQYVLSRLWANVELSLLGLLKPTLFAIFYSIFWFWIFSLYA